MKKIAIAASALLAVALLTGFRGGGWSRDPGRIQQIITWKLDDKLDDIDASDAQKQSIHALKDRLFSDGQRMMGEQKATRLEVLAQLESDRPDSQKLHALVDARIDAMRAFAHQVTDAALEAHRLLTPQQRQELATEYREHADLRER
ncbi:Spy/CpxP family protein refolding chaperone [Stigmatella erecta]|uniref:Protein refolding chaperone Spy/CpxP family n=1 Tax=Stigmatella erecta TaxID=83460 RepID=A0A1I0DN69_9BACT|nr:Spy/CpxP family protein refolding chaperone [Stigmatella erecta]SET33309.1 protein refolding chaperone Spy/CpxP family [Stigmatella erecta]